MTISRHRAGPGRAPAFLLAFALPTVVAFAACGSSTPPSSPGTVISAFVAASLRDVLSALGPAYTEASGVQIQTSADASTTLRVQIEQGAEADVFLSADTVNPETLLAGGRVDGGLVLFAQSSLAIIAPKNNPAGISSALDLGRPGVKIVAAGGGAPITGYADRLVRQLARLAADPSAFVATYAANVVTREDNVKAVVAKIALGEGDAAIVYATDALAATSILVIPVPAGSNILATYAGVVPSTARHPGDGHRFLDWLAGAPGQAILARFGFVPLIPGPS
ncbi:MAG: molybdate ABC transporter substrate-binding protein [Chloroflexota bacterium]